MKKFLLSLMAVLTASFVMADNVQISWTGLSDWTEGDQSISLTSKGVALTAVKNSGSTTPTVNGNYNDLRVYAKGSLTVNAGSATITEIVFNISTQGMKRMTDIEASTGAVKIDMEAKTATWTGSASSVSLTVGDKATYGSDGDSKAGQFDVDAPISVTCTGTPDCEGGNTGDETEQPEEVNISNTLETAYTVPQAIALIDAGKGLSTKVYVKGIICADYKDIFVDRSYQNCTFFISEDGKTESPQFEIFRGYSFGGEKFTENEDFKLGDEVVFYGTLTKYKDTYELAQGCELILLNGKGNSNAIRNINADNASKAVYNLMGQRVAKTQKGLYIQNGKVVLK